MIFTPQSGIYRYTIFGLSCLASFGTYYSFDAPTALQKHFEAHANTSCHIQFVRDNGSFCCKTCLGLSPLQFNYLFASLSWVKAITVLPCGYFLDKFGSGWSGVCFSAIVMISSIVFAIGFLPSIRDTNLTFPILLAGRILLGSSIGGIRIVQDRIATFWFKDDISFAFGFLVTFFRLSTVINYLITESIADSYGLDAIAWICVVVCGIGVISASILNVLHNAGVRKLTCQPKFVFEDEDISLRDILHFPRTYWCLMIIMVFYAGGTLPFLADSSKFVQDKYHFSPLTASYISGIVFDVCMIVAPIVGLILDYVGHRGWGILLFSIIMLPIFPLLAFTDIHPAVAFVGIGVSFSICGVSTWPIIAMVIDPSKHGMAFAVSIAIISVGIGLNNWAVGTLLGTSTKSAPYLLEHWQPILILGFINVIVSFFFSVIINVIDSSQGHIINRKGVTPDLSVSIHSPHLRDSETSPLLRNNNILPYGTPTHLACDFYKKQRPDLLTASCTKSRTGSFSSSLNFLLEG